MDLSIVWPIPLDQLLLGDRTRQCFKHVQPGEGLRQTQNILDKLRFLGSLGTLWCPSEKLEAVAKESCLDSCDPNPDKWKTMDG